MKTQAARERASLLGKNPRLEEKTAEVYLLLPAGTFDMGCTAGDTDCSENEKPAHPVTIGKPFYMAATPTTKLAYQKCIDAGVCQGQTDPAKPQHPVVNTRWSDAVAYCAWIGGRLPTEAEWEYAARGGTEGWRFPWGNGIATTDANFATAKTDIRVDAVGVQAFATMLGLTYRYAGTSPVETFADNGFGLYDMAGNVLEWTQDWEGPYQAGAATDPRGPAAGEARVLRGGSWAVTANTLRVSHRFSFGPENQVETIGFRCVIDP